MLQALKYVSPVMAGVDLYQNREKYLPAMKAVAQGGAKAFKYAAEHLPQMKEGYEQTRNLSTVLHYLKNHTVSYLPKEGGGAFSGETSDTIGYFFKSKGDAWSVLDPKYDKKDTDHIAALLRQVLVHTPNVDLMQVRVAQILTKQLIANCSRSLKPGFEIEIPVLNSKGVAELVNYRIDQKFDLGDGIPAFGFIDPNGVHPPLLIFRPTNLDIQYVDSVSSLVANLDPKGPAWKLYEAAKDEIDVWLQESTQDGQNKARVMGFSQGGILATYFLTYHSRYFSRKVTQPSFVLDGPGMPLNVAREWSGVQKKPHVWSFVNRGDLVPKMGSELIGRVFELSVPQKMSPIQSHKAMTSLAKRWEIKEVDKGKEKRSEIRKAFLGVQKLGSHKALPLIQEYLMPTLREFCIPV